MRTQIHARRRRLQRVGRRPARAAARLGTRRRAAAGSAALLNVGQDILRARASRAARGRRRARAWVGRSRASRETACDRGRAARRSARPGRGRIGWRLRCLCGECEACNGHGPAGSNDGSCHDIGLLSGEGCCAHPPATTEAAAGTAPRTSAGCEQSATFLVWQAVDAREAVASFLRSASVHLSRASRSALNPDAARYCLTAAFSWQLSCIVRPHERVDEFSN